MIILKRTLYFTIPVLISVFLYWLRGGEFERGLPLASAVVIGIVIGTLAVGTLGEFE